MTDEINMSGQAGISYPVSIAEYLAKRSDPVTLKHLNIHTFTYWFFTFFWGIRNKLNKRY